jgi:hypothetical protein
MPWSGVHVLYGAVKKKGKYVCVCVCVCVCGLEMHTSPDMILLKASVRWWGLSESFIVRKFSMLKVLRTLPNTYGREYGPITFFLLVVVLGSFLSTLNTFIAEEYRLRHELSEYHVYALWRLVLWCKPFCSSKWGGKKCVWKLLYRCVCLFTLVNLVPNYNSWLVDISLDSCRNICDLNFRVSRWSLDYAFRVSCFFLDVNNHGRPVSFLEDACSR